MSKPRPSSREYWVHIEFLSLVGAILLCGWTNFFVNQPRFESEGTLILTLVLAYFPASLWLEYYYAWKWLRLDGKKISTLFQFTDSPMLQETIVHFFQEANGRLPLPRELTEVSECIPYAIFAVRKRTRRAVRAFLVCTLLFSFGDSFFSLLTSLGLLFYGTGALILSFASDEDPTQ